MDGESCSTCSDRVGYCCSTCPKYNSGACSVMRRVTPFVLLCFSHLDDYDELNANLKALKQSNKPSSEKTLTFEFGGLGKRKQTPVSKFGFDLETSSGNKKKREEETPEVCRCAEVSYPCHFILLHFTQGDNYFIFRRHGRELETKTRNRQNRYAIQC